MKKITEYINEAFNSQALYDYVIKVREFFKKYNVTLENNKKKLDKYEQARSSGKYASYPRLAELSSFKAYPMAIIIDKFGYSKKLIQKPRQAEQPDWSDYAKFIVNKCKEENKTNEDLAKWWWEYDNEIIKKNWQDPKWLLKQIDFDRFWNPFYPNDDSCLKSVIETPQKIFTYVKSDKTAYWKLTEDERKEVADYYTDPTNAEALSKAIKSAKKSIEAQRPTYEKALQEWLKSILANAEFEGEQFGSRYDLEDELEKERNKTRDMYSGSNDRNELASAMSTIITNALDEKFNFNKDPKELVDNADYVSVFVKELGMSKKGSEHSSVWSSSFWTYYKYDFEVTIFKGPKDDRQEIFKKRYDNVTVASTYYSGGWW